MLSLCPQGIWFGFGISCAQVGGEEWSWLSVDLVRGQSDNLGTKTLLFVELLDLGIMEGAFLSQANGKWRLPPNGGQ